MQNEYQYAIVIPCYNEASRLPFNDFLSFAQTHPETILCFVNDGSSDQTAAILSGLQSQSPENICVYSLVKNGGKAEAVRKGMLYVCNHFNIPLVGYLDADMATLPEEWLEMARYRDAHPQFGAVIGSRINRLGADIKRNDDRSLFSFIIKKIVGIILHTSFQDTQCGAKIFHRNMVPFIFHKPFMTPWLFDVEIFLRLQKKFGKRSLYKGVLEFPLMHWEEVGESKLKFKHAVKIPWQLVQLYYRYRIAAYINPA